MKISKFLPLIGVAIFVYIILNINISRVFESFLLINHLFVIAIGIFFVTILLRAWRWEMIIRSYGIDFPLMSALKGWLIGFSIGLITPGKVGDLSRSYYLSGRKNIGRSLTTVMVERVIDLLVLFTLSVIGLALFATFYVKDDFLLLATIAFFVLFVFVVAFFSKKKFASFILRPFYMRFVPEKKRMKLKNVYDDFYSGLWVILSNKKRLFGLLILTFFVWFIIIYYTFILTSMLNLGVSYWFLLMTFPLVILAIALPISFSGLGTREASLIFFLSFVGVPAEAAITFSLLHMFSDYVVASVGFWLWFRNPIKLRE